MVGSSPQSGRPARERVLAGLDAIDALEYYLTRPAERQALRDDIARLQEMSERARVGNDLEAARAEASKLVSDAKEKARQTEIEAARARAQAEEVLAAAQRSKDAGEKEIAARRALLENYEKRLNAKEFDLGEAKKKQDQRDRDHIVKANQLKLEEDRLKALANRIEAALRGP